MAKCLEVKKSAESMKHVIYVEVEPMINTDKVEQEFIDYLNAEFLKMAKDNIESEE